MRMNDLVPRMLEHSEEIIFDHNIEFSSFLKHSFYLKLEITFLCFLMVFYMKRSSFEGSSSKSNPSSKALSKFMI